MKKTPPPEPLASWDIGPSRIVIYAHATEVRALRNGTFFVGCRFREHPDRDAGCPYRATFADRAAAREAADAHIISTHVTGDTECGQPNCTGDTAIRRVRRREADTA